MIDFRTIAAAMNCTDEPTFTGNAVIDKNGFLVEQHILAVKEMSRYIKCPCGGDHCADVEEADSSFDSAPKYMAFCEETGIPYEVPRTELLKWQVKVSGIMKLIQQEFECREEASMRCAHLWYLGESGRAIAGRRRQIFFASMITKDVEESLPEGISQILFLGELHPSPVRKFEDRIFQMHEVMNVRGRDYRFDRDLVESRLRKIEGQEQPKEIPIPKDAAMTYRAGLILEFLDERILTLRDAYWNATKTDLNFKLPRRPSCQAIADYIRVKTNGTQTPDQATVNRTIKEYKDDPMLQLLWKNITDITFVRDYKRKKRQASPRVRKETDAEYLDAMFGETAPEPPGSGYHVV